MKELISEETTGSRMQLLIRHLGLIHTGRSFLGSESIITVAGNPELKEARQNMHRI